MATRGRAYFLDGEFTLAESDLVEALLHKDAVASLASAYYYLALVYVEQGNTMGAQQAWLDVIATHDKSSPHQREWADEARQALGQ